MSRLHRLATVPEHFANLRGLGLTRRAALSTIASWLRGWAL